MLRNLIIIIIILVTINHLHAQKPIPKKTKIQLHNAVKENNIKKVKRLINAGFDVNQLDHNQETALFYTIRYRHNKIARLLLKNGAKANIKNKQGDTCLYIAASQGNNSLIYELVKHGAEISHKDKNGVSIKKIYLNKTNESILHWYVVTDNISKLKSIATKKQDINNKNNNGIPYIFYAVTQHWSHYALPKLLKHKPDLNITDRNGMTVLMFAAALPDDYENNKAVLSLLLKAGADPNQKSKRGLTALYYAINSEYYDTINVLLNYNIKKNWKTCYTLGNIYLKEGHYKEAISYYNQALQSNDKNSPTYINPGNAYFKLNKLKQAKRYYQQALNLDPKKNIIMYNLACLYSEQHNIKQALLWLNRALKAGYNNYSMILLDIDLDNARQSKRFKKLRKKYNF